MDLSIAAQDDSSDANPSSVKSDGSSPQAGSGRRSPPPKCAICLGTCRNKSFTDSCLHQFCFKCLLTWSKKTSPSSVKSDGSSPQAGSGRRSSHPKCAICLGTCRKKSFADSCLHQSCFKCLLTRSKVKAECPLCKQNFRSIIHNVRSNHQYEEYMVEQRTEETVERIDIDNITATRRFRYRTTLTLPRRETIAIQQLLLQYPLMADVFPPPAHRAAPARRRRSPTAFRRTVYRHNLWARPLPDFTGRFRDCTPEFYRYNASQMHRLVPWINRELHYLLNENVGHIAYVLERILELLPHHAINSPAFSEAMQRFFGERTEHFLHELYCFASTPYDMTGYDRYVQYTTDRRISTMVNEVISSSDSEASVDSDILIISSSEPAEAWPGPSDRPAPLPQPPPPVYPAGYIPQPPTNVIPIETISHSDTDDDSSEVMVVGYIKPPQDRTPEVVDLLGSDSDVVVQDTQPETSQSSEPPIVPVVKMTLKRHAPQRVRDSESEDSNYTPPSPRRRKRQRSYDSATTAGNTNRSTPSPCFSSTIPSSNTTQMATTSSRAWSDSTYSWSSTSDTSISTSDFDLSDTSTSSSSSGRRKRRVKKKSRRKSRTENLEKKKSKKSSSRSHHKRKRSSSKTDSQKDKRSKRKSHSGKGVKSSKKSSETPPEGTPPPPPTPPLPATTDPQPGPSGISGAIQKVSTKTNSERRNSREKKRRISCENKRLKSVVNVMYKHSNDKSPTLNSYVNNISVPVHSTSSNYGSTASEERIEDPPSTSHSETKIESESRSNSDKNDTDPEDNLPLNLTLQKSCHFS